MTAIQVFKKYGAHYYDDDEEAIIKAMDEYAESKAKEAWNAACQLQINNCLDALRPTFSDSLAYADVLVKQ